MFTMLNKIIIIFFVLSLNSNIVTAATASPTPTAEETLEEMTLEQKVGQLFLAKYEGFNPLSVAQEYHLGGFIWYAKDFIIKFPQKVRNEISFIQDNVTIPMFIAVDEEGGTVNRISSYRQYRNEPFLTPRDYFTEGGWSLVENIETEKAELLNDLGLNLNLGIVVDIPLSSEDYIFPRSFSTNADDVSLLTDKVVKIYKDKKVGNVLKHFPGYGNNVDTHQGIAYDNRSLSELKMKDFLPFEAGIKSGVNGILISHTIFTQIDPINPSSLSKDVISLLRNDLKYNGLIITDDLLMDGLSSLVTPEESAILAVEAGNDLLISSQVQKQIPAILLSIEEGRLTEERIDESVLRILNSKIQLEIIK